MFVGVELLRVKKPSIAGRGLARKICHEVYYGE
jgi:hypothetical protein